AGALEGEQRDAHRPGVRCREERARLDQPLADQSHAILTTRGDRGSYSLPTITSEALMMAAARSPFFSRSSRMASIVIEAVTIAPPPMSSFTWPVVAPRTTWTPRPLRTFPRLGLTPFPLLGPPTA